MLRIHLKRLIADKKTTESWGIILSNISEATWHPRFNPITLGQSSFH